MQIIISNSHAALTQSLTEILAIPHHESPLDEDWILVPNRDAGRWLQVHLTETLGTLANVRFFSVEDALALLSPTPPDPTCSARLFWRVACEWSATHPETAPALLADQLCRLTQLFTACLTERPDWLTAWEQGRSVVAGDRTIGPLWQAVQKAEGFTTHTDRLALAQGRLTPQTDTLSRLFVFCPDRLSDMALACLKQVSEVRIVALWIQSPSPEGWFLERDVDETGVALNHPLLQDLAIEKARFMRQLIAETTVDGYQPPTHTAETALNQLAQSLFQNHALDAPIAPDDSISFYAATSPTDEVWALKKWVMAYLNEDPSHSLRDLSIVATDPGLYGPIVQRVFSDMDPKRHLPTAPDPLTITPLLQAGIALLADSKRLGFRANRVLHYLTHESVRTQFDLSDRDIRTLERWLNDSGARRGVKGHRHSLAAAKARLLNGLLADPARAVESNAVITEPLEQSLLLDTVLAVFEAIESFVALPDYATLDETLTALNDSLKRLSLDALHPIELPGLDDSILSTVLPWTVLPAYLELGASRGLSRPVALGDQVSVTSVQTIRAMRQPLVAVLGANDGTLPSESPIHAWDLIAQHPRAGDLIEPEAERQAFFDALINTEKKLWIGWQGRHPISLEPELPASAVTALLSALGYSPDERCPWIEQGAMGLPLPLARVSEPTVSQSLTTEPQTRWRDTDWIATAMDPAAAFLAGKGAKLASPPEDRLDQEPLTLSPLHTHRLKTLFLESGDADQIARWLKQHPEFPDDVEADAVHGLTPDRVKAALSAPRTQFPNTELILGPYSIEVHALATAAYPRITLEKEPNGRRTLAAYLDMLLGFCLMREPSPMHLVTFGNKIYRIQPMAQSEAKALAQRWCEVLSHNVSRPCPLIAPLAVQHAELLLKDPNAPLELTWNGSPLVHRPYYRRLFAHQSGFETRHRELVSELVVPLVALRERRSRADF